MIWGLLGFVALIAVIVVLCARKWRASDVPDDVEENDDSHVEVLQPVERLRVLRTFRVTDPEFGECIEIVVDVDPNRPPATFRGKTLDEAMDAARRSQEQRRAMQDDAY